MEENKVDVILSKKMDGYYNGNLNNFTTRDELVVTITLNEYRELIKASAVAESEKLKLQSENYDLRRQVNELSVKLNELVLGKSNGETADE